MNAILFLVSLLYLPGTTTLVSDPCCRSYAVLAYRLGECFDYVRIFHCFTDVPKGLLVSLWLILVEYAKDLLTWLQQLCCLDIGPTLSQDVYTALSNDECLSRRLLSNSCIS